MEDDESFQDSLEELDDCTDSGSDYELTLKATKRGKRAVRGPQPPKKPRRKAALSVTSSPMSSPIPTPPDSSLQQQDSPGIRRQAPPRPVSTMNEQSQGISAEDIYDAVYSGKSAMVTVVDMWLDSYKQSQKTGLLVLINFILRSCGCKGVVSAEMLDSMPNAEIISTLTKEFNEDLVTYPLSTPGLQLKRFKAGLCEFARVLVRSCQNSLIYDEYLFPSLLALLTGLSDSQVRAFRHTSTLLAMKLMTELVEVAVKVSIQLQTTQRRYDMENSKGAQDRASDRLVGLQDTIRELQENREEVASMMNGMFRGVFMHRYRDRLPEIRSVCIEGLGIWLKTDPEDFLNDGCLKYLGWTLYDKQCPVRLQCVRALQGLYQEKEFIGRLELFTSRFKERMLRMVQDKDPDVAVEMVNLLQLLQQRTEEGLTEEECGHIYPLVYALHRGLATAAGRFLYNKLKDVISSDKQENDESDNTAFIQVLICFFVQSEFHEHAAYLVDSLWDVAGSELRDWKTMTAFLLKDGDLTYDEEGVLIELMVCTIKQAAQATPPVGRAPGKKTLSMKDRNVQEQDKRHITAHFIPLLPQLLAKYSVDEGKVSHLLKVPLYFDLEVYTSAPRLEKHLDLLLCQICSIMEKHVESTVLEACAQLVSTLGSDRYTFSSRAHLAFSQLLDTLVEYFTAYLGVLLQGTADDTDVYSAAAALKRIAALSSAKNLTGLKLFDPCLELLKSLIESRDLYKELMVSALKCAAFHLMWAKVNAVNSKPPQAEQKHLKKDVHSFCRVCQNCLSLDQTEIRGQAFELLCDLLILYNENAVRFEPALQTLVHVPSDSLRSDMAGFLLDYVFSDAEDAELTDEGQEEMKITLLQKKRNQLAGYCKLVAYGVLDLTAATDVFKHYSKYFKDFGDIIKETLSKSKLINPVQSSKTICLSLQQLFAEMISEDHSRQDLDEIRDLAKRLSMSFGVDLHRAREPLVALHMDGISFAFRDSQEGQEQHPNVAFLEILSEFSFKLLQQDRAQLAVFLNSKCPYAALSWPSVRMYKRSLEVRSAPKPREQQQEDGDGVSLHNTPVAKRRRTSVQDARETGSISTAGRGSWLDSSSIHSSLHTPALTSTVQRQPAKQPISRVTESNISKDLAEQKSEDEFSSGFQMRKVKTNKRRQPIPILDRGDIDSNFSLLSLFESNQEREETDAELPTPCRTSATVLDELFD